MKKLLSLLLLVPVIAQAQTNTQPKIFGTQQPCAPVMEMLKTPAKYGESMLFTGNGVQFSSADGLPYTSGAFFFVNQDTGTWTLLSIYGDGFACLIANGKGFEPYTGGQPWDKKPEEKLTP